MIDLVMKCGARAALPKISACRMLARELWKREQERARNIFPTVDADA